MEEATTTPSLDHFSWLDEFGESNSVSTTVSYEDAASLSADEQSQNRQSEEPDQQNREDFQPEVLDGFYTAVLKSFQTENESHLQNLSVNQPETNNWYPQAEDVQPPVVHVQPPVEHVQPPVFDPQNEPQIENVSHLTELLVNQTETYKRCPQAVHVQPPAGIPQPTAAVDPRNEPQTQNMSHLQKLLVEQPETYTWYPQAEPVQPSAVFDPQNEPLIENESHLTELLVNQTETYNRCLQAVHVQPPADIPQPTAVNDVQNGVQIENVPHRQNLPFEQTETYNWYPQAAQVQPSVGIPQSTTIVGPLVADNEPPLLVPTGQHSNGVVAPPQLYILFLDKDKQTLGMVAQPAHEKLASAYVDVQQPGTSGTGQCKSVLSTDSLPLVEQWHLEPAIGSRIADVYVKEFSISQPEKGPAVSKDQNTPPLGASAPQNGIGEKKYPCPLCHKKFFSQKHVAKHGKKRHSGERFYMCEYAGCIRTFIRGSDLSRHIRRHTSNDTPPYQCPPCLLNFKSTAKFETHTQAQHD